MNDAWETLEPDPTVTARMEARLLEALAARERPLALEWVELARARPASTTLLLAAAAAFLVVATPLGAALALLARLA